MVDVSTSQGYTLLLEGAENPPLIVPLRLPIVEIIVAATFRLAKDDQVLFEVVLLFDEVALRVDEAAATAVGAPAGFPEGLHEKVRNAINGSR